jgi:hypothetical protein
MNPNIRYKSKLSSKIPEYLFGPVFKKGSNTPWREEVSKNYWVVLLVVLYKSIYRGTHGD